MLFQQVGIYLKKYEWSGSQEDGDWTVWTKLEEFDSVKWLIVDMLFQPVGIYLKKYEWSGSQEGGDCSLWVRAATLEFDDGEWECQVTASDFTTQDALTSAPVRLVVRGKSLSHVNSCTCKLVEHVI